MTKRITAILTIVALWAIALLPSVYAKQQSSSTNQQSQQDRAKQKSDNQHNTSSQQSGTATAQAGTLDNNDRKFIIDAAHGGMAEVALGRLALERASSDEVKQFAQRMIDDHSRANGELMQLASTKGVTMPDSHAAMLHGDASQGNASQANTGNTSQTSGQAANTKSGSQSGKDQRQQDKSGASTSQMQTTMQHDNTSSSAHSSDAGRAMLDRKHQALYDKLSRLSGAAFDRQYMREMVKDHSDAVAMFQREASRGKDADVRGWAAGKLPALQDHLRMARDLEATTRRNRDKN